MSARRRPPAHVCREHILVRPGHKGFARKYVCSVCRKVVDLSLRPRQVLARVSA